MARVAVALTCTAQQRSELIALARSRTAVVFGGTIRSSVVAWAAAKGG
jgi:hypothetical protein